MTTTTDETVRLIREVAELKAEVLALQRKWVLSGNPFMIAMFIYANLLIFNLLVGGIGYLLFLLAIGLSQAGRR